MRLRLNALFIALLGCLALTARVSAEEAAPAAPKVEIHKTTGPITIDGDLSDAGWQSATKFETWYETRPGDNIEPKVRQTGYVTYDDHFFYVGVDMADPNPRAIGGTFGDRDQISGNSDDFAGIILDTRNDGKTGYEFFVTARGVQFDAVQDEAGGNEDSSPDFYWDGQAKINDHGWTMEMRIPFSSLRYTGANPEQWGMILYRNLPRDRRYQIFTQKLPRGQNCFVCNFTKITGLRGLPSGGHIVAAPYMTSHQVGQADTPGGSIHYSPAGGDIGGDIKWTPTADMAVDATINPDFSQIESDVAVISTNERFAIFFPEKRPFFLEGVELFNTPITAVYTRTITSPRWGLRSTGKLGGNAYTLLIAQDRGGGDVIIPSTYGSDFGRQDFSSLAAIGRVRHDFGKSSFISLLGTTRESSGGAHNRVLGPDFQIKNDHHQLTGQILFSDTVNPDRPDLARSWNGEKLTGHAAWVWYWFSGKKWDLLVDGRHYTKDFRADNGFVPQVGYRVNYGELGRTFYPEKSFFSRIRTFGMGEYQSTHDDKLLYRLISGGIGADGKFRSFIRFRYAYETIRNEEDVFQRHQLLYNINFAVNKVLTQLYVNGSVGQDIDFVNARLGRGANVSFGGSLRASEHLRVDLTNSVRWLNVRPNGTYDRLFTSQVERVRATYTFNNRMFLRTILQNERTNRDTNLYGFPSRFQHRGDLATQLLFAYKLNWQTLMYLGVGDLEETTVDGDLKPSSRQVFLKLSYAFQR